MSHIERIYWIDRQIRAGAYPNPAKVAERFEVSRRTAQSDKTLMLDRLHAPIEYSREHGGWYYGDHSWVLPAVTMTEGEILAMLIGERILKQYFGTVYEPLLRSALVKLSRYLPQEVNLDLTQAGESFVFSSGATIEEDPQLMLDIVRAAREKKAMRITYYSASSDEVAERIIEPYCLHGIRGALYLIAYCHRRQEVRDFLPSRIRQWELLDTTFEIPPDFSLKDYLEQGFSFQRGGPVEEVEIWFSPRVSRWVRPRPWHSSQTMEENPDGSLILRFRVGGLSEVKRWAMSYGPEAELRRPVWLREEIKEDLQRMVGVYAQ